MKPRITVDLTIEGAFAIPYNEAGRALPVKRLRALSKRNDHIFLGRADIGEVEVCSRPNRPDDKILEHGKILFETDDWDRPYFPHVLDAGAATRGRDG